MDLSKKKRYDELVEETRYVLDKLASKPERYYKVDFGAATAILVASEHSNEDLGQLTGFIQKR